MTNESVTANEVTDFPGQIIYKRCLRKDRAGKVIETPSQLYHRVANCIASVDASYGAKEEHVSITARRFEEAMVRGIFLPNSPTLIGAGREKGMLSACFVLPVPDDIEGIFETVKNTALIQKAGGGTGFSFDALRPTGDIVTSSGGRTSGPISFWKVLAETTSAIQQGAHRRGANMGLMSLEHPDIIKFIFAKQNTSAFTNYNISVKVTDAYMDALDTNPDSLHVVKNPRTGKRYVIPRSVNIDSYTIDDLLPAEQPGENCFTVSDIWNMIISNAHANGEPGICFIDHVNKDNPLPHVGLIVATNPCGEAPLLIFESCNLGSINISAFIHPNQTDLLWDELGQTVRMAVHFLDNVIDANHYPIPEVKEVTLGNRKIGLGIMGFADTLFGLGIRYDSEQAVSFAHKVGAFIQENAHQASEDLARERGSFPHWKGSVWDTKYDQPMRNAICTTIAPTGTISTLAGCNGGIEPIFSITTKRRALDDKEFVQLTPYVESVGTAEGWLNEDVRQQLTNGVHPREIPAFPPKLSSSLVTAHEIAPEWHVRIQAAFQEHVDNAISKTVNLPSSAPVGDVDKVFRLAFELGCKGITIYRDSSRQNQVITAAHKQTSTKYLTPRKRPRKTSGITVKARTGCGTLFINTCKDDHGLCEVFANLGKAGGCPAQSEATCRVVSAALRCGVDPTVLIEQLKSIRCLSTITRRKENKDIKVLSCPDAIARAIEEALSGYEPEIIATNNPCPECGYPLRYEEGCGYCDKCEYQKCD